MGETSHPGLTLREYPEIPGQWASPAPLAASEAHGNPCRSLAAARYNLSHRRFGRFWGVLQLGPCR